MESRYNSRQTRNSEELDIQEHPMDLTIPAFWGHSTDQAQITPSPVTCAAPQCCYPVDLEQKPRRNPSSIGAFQAYHCRCPLICWSSSQQPEIAAEAHRGNLHGSLVPLVDFLGAHRIKGQVNRRDASLQPAIVLGQCLIVSAEPEPEDGTGQLGAQAAEVLALTVAQLDLVAKGLEDGNVEVSHGDVVAAHGQADMRECHDCDAWIW